jgi:histidinol-phosphate aminotransferase
MADANPFLQLCAPGIAQLKPYSPGKPTSELERELGVADSIKLASNENPLGPSPLAIQAAAAQLGALARYPDGGGFELRQALARRHGVAPEAITLGNGSNDVLDLVARTFLAPDSEAVFSRHAFAVYPICTQAVGASACVAPAHDGTRGPRYGHDLEAMRACVGESTRVVFIANPNNPTGTWLPRDQLYAFLRAMPSHLVVVVDEAYFEYVEAPDYPDASSWLGEFPNLIVIRTFSKAYGLAALRVGYSLSHPDVAALLNRVRQPFNVNALALAAARAALGDEQHLREVVRRNREGMALLESGLRGLGLTWIPSGANFLCVDLGRPAADIDARLLRRGCIARPVANYGLPEHLRVTVGLEAENLRFLDALKEALGA